MNRTDFEEHVKNGRADDYVAPAALEFMAKNLPIEVSDSRGMGDPRRDVDKTLVSRSFPTENTLSDEELKTKVQELLIDGNRDIQKRNVVKGGTVVKRILVLSADYGFEAISMF